MSFGTPSTGIARRAIRALLVERDVDAEQRIRAAIDRAGWPHFTLDVAHTPTDAAFLLDARTYDLVLMDLAPPNDGDPANHEALRQCAPKLPFVVIVRTTDDGSGVRAIRDDALVEHVAAESMTDELLIRTIRHTMERHLLVAEARRRGELVSSERERSNQLRESLLAADRLKSVGQLAAGVAHEVNNATSFVTANHESIAASFEQLHATLAQVRREMAGLEVDAARRIDALLTDHGIDALLTETRATIEENRLGLERITDIVKGLQGFTRSGGDAVEWVRAGDVVHDAVTMVKNEIRARGELRIDVEEGMPAVAARHGALVQVLVNLLLNSTHALTDDGPHEITLSAGCAESSIVIAVADTGTGIEPDVLPHVFEPFFTTKAREQGTGLGLSVSAEILREHGGELRVSSVLGEGTTFEAVIPLETGLTVTDVDELRSGTVRANGPRRRILIVDDEPMLLRALQRTVGRSTEVHLAEGGEAAIATLKEDTRFDAVVCDLMMPEPDGPAVYSWISQHAEHLKRRVVFLSGGAFTSRTKSFVESVPNRVVDKPVDPGRLREIIEELAG